MDNTVMRENLTGENKEGRYPNKPLRLLTASSVIGDKIVNSSGEDLGNIKDVMLDINEGKIEYLVIEFGGFLGIGEKLFAIPFPLLRVDPHQHAFILDQSKETLKRAPGFDKDQWPETNDHTFSSVRTYWGGFMGQNTGGPY